MNRRGFLSLGPAVAGCAISTPAFASSSVRPITAFVIVELDGGNDGLNSVIPYTDLRYYALRPTLAVPREQVLQLDARTGLHPALRALMPAWRAGHLAIVQGVGYAMPNRSHFRSRQIWHSASRADEYRDTTPLAGIEREIGRSSFVESCIAASHEIAKHDESDGVIALRLTLHGFDTHENQAWRHAAQLAQLAQGLATLRGALIRSGDWPKTFVMTASEFGRSARENASGGTEHGAASAHFVMGGRVASGVHGLPPNLDALDEAGGLAADIDFRRLYATAHPAFAAHDLAPLAILRT